LTCDDRAETSIRLYVKPDDRWEVSEVSDRCRETVEQLKAVGEHFICCARSGQRGLLQPLDSNLLELLR
jgi:hypothetical protein